jgi:hypothetical protein
MKAEKPVLGIKKTLKKKTMVEEKKKRKRVKVPKKTEAIKPDAFKNFLSGSPQYIYIVEMMKNKTEDEPGITKGQKRRRDKQ